MPLVFDILLPFRAQKVALSGDLEQAFLNISVNPSHRDYLHFLWHDNVFTENLRLMFGLASSPFVSNATIQHHMHKYHGLYCEFVLKVE